MSKKKLTALQLSQKVSQLLKKKMPVPGSGAASIPSLAPLVESGGASDLDGLVARMFASGASQERAREQLAAARATARTTRQQAQAAQSVAAAKATESGPLLGTPSVSPTVAAASGGPRILLDYVVPPPHTLTNDKGKYCETFRWFNKAFLVYDPALPMDAKGSEANPWFGLEGPKFRCYFPNSSDADFEACMTSGSSGRWLNAWPQRRNYVAF